MWTGAHDFHTPKYGKKKKKGVCEHWAAKRDGHCRHLSFFLKGHYPMQRPPPIGTQSSF